MITFRARFFHYLAILGIATVVLFFAFIFFAGQSDDPCNYYEEWKCGPPNFINDYDCGCIPLDIPRELPYPKGY